MVGDWLGVHLYSGEAVYKVSPPTLTVAPRRRDRNREAQYISRTLSKRNMAQRISEVGRRRERWR